MTKKFHIFFCRGLSAVLLILTGCWQAQTGSTSVPKPVAPSDSGHSVTVSSRAESPLPSAPEVTAPTSGSYVTAFAAVAHLWNGSAAGYCNLTFHNFREIQRILLHGDTLAPPPLPTLAHAHELADQHQYQQAIWEFEEVGTAESSHLAEHFSRILHESLVSHRFSKTDARALGGGNPKVLLGLDHGITGIFKEKASDLWEGAHYPETAAFEIDLFLKMNLVPATANRSIDVGNPGTVMVFMKGLEQNSPDAVLMKNFSDQKVLDYIIGSGDRKYDNVLFSRRLNRLVAIDNSIAFKARAVPDPYNRALEHECGTAPQVYEFLKMNPGLLRRISHFHHSDLVRILAGKMDEPNIADTWDRIAHLQALILADGL